MKCKVPAWNPDAPIIVIDIGNSTTGVATWHKGALKTPMGIPTMDDARFHEVLHAHLGAMPGGRAASVVISSVVPKALSRIRARVDDALKLDALVIGESVSLPLDVGVTDAKAIGVDRVCAAAAAFETLKSACTVVGFGSAVTVDLVDDDGVLVGGAILPGVRMQLCALHEHTALLPQVDPAIPETPYGRNTMEAIQTGVCRGLAGAVRGLVEGYATYLNRWPHVVATGGDLPRIGPLCDFIDTQVQHLVLRGVGVAYMKHLEAMGV